MAKYKAYYFIDYDDLQENGDETLNVLFGDEKIIADAKLVARFIEDEDATEYCDWKNFELDRAEAIEEVLDEPLMELTDEEYWDAPE